MPLIVRWPGVVEPGTVTHALVDFTDFLPTFAAIGETSLPNGVAFDGVSFVPVLQRAPGAVRSYAACEHKGKAWVRDQRWKLYSDGRLFLVADDPLEKKPVRAETPEVTKVRAELAAELARVFPASGDKAESRKRQGRPQPVQKKQRAHAVGSLAAARGHVHDSRCPRPGLPGSRPRYTVRTLKRVGERSILFELPSRSFGTRSGRRRPSDQRE